MLSYFTYIKERFPIIPALLFSFGYAALAVGLSYENNIWRSFPLITFKNLLLLSGILFFFLLRQRATDEFKDSDHDRKYFPSRPVPRGLITKKQIFNLGLFALIMELTLVYFTGLKTFGLYLLIFIYSLFMAKEFFIPEWLEKHFTIYFLIHEIIFILFALYFISALNFRIIKYELYTFILLTILTLTPISIEIIRKFKPRFDRSGKPVPDTYSTVWGRKNALYTLISLSLLTGIGLSYLKNSYIYIIFSFIILAFWIFLGKKSDTAVLIIGAVNFLGLALLVNIIW